MQEIVGLMIHAAATRPGRPCQTFSQSLGGALGHRGGENSVYPIWSRRARAIGLPWSSCTSRRARHGRRPGAAARRPGWSLTWGTRGRRAGPRGRAGPAPRRPARRGSPPRAGALVPGRPTATWGRRVHSGPPLREGQGWSRRGVERPRPKRVKPRDPTGVADRRVCLVGRPWIGRLPDQPAAGSCPGVAASPRPVRWG